MTAMNFITNPVFAGILQHRQSSGGTLTNWALTANGATFSAPNGSVSAGGLAGLGNGDRTTGGSYDPATNTWVSGGYNPSTPAVVICEFPSPRTITNFVVVGLREAVHYSTPPTSAESNPTYKNIDFTIDRWNGSAWANVATVTGNDKVVKENPSSPASTTKWRLSVTNGAASNIYLVELEAWG